MCRRAGAEAGASAPTQDTRGTAREGESEGEGEGEGEGARHGLARARRRWFERRAEGMLRAKRPSREINRLAPRKKQMPVVTDTSEAIHHEACKLLYILAWLKEDATRHQATTNPQSMAQTPEQQRGALFDRLRLRWN